MIINPFTKQVLNHAGHPDQSVHGRRGSTIAEKPFSTPFDPYVRRDRRVRSGLAKAMGVSLREVEDLDWKEVLEMAKEAGVNTDYD